MLAENAIQHTSTLYFSKPAVELAKKLVKQTTGNFESSCYLTNSGSEANEVAFLAARVFTGEVTIVALRHAYHGGTNQALAACGHATWKFPAQPQSHVVHAVEPYCYRCPYGKKPDTCALECADDVEKVIQTTTHGKIAAFIMEPIMGVGGFIDPPITYHKKVFDIVKKYGGLFISDEVQTGVGRTGKNFFAITDSQVAPDLITMAKGLGNGAAIGAVIARKEVADALKGKTHFNTFGGDPFQATQALTTLEIIESEQGMKNAQAMGDFILSELKEMQKDFSFIGDVRGRGLMIGVEIVADKSTKIPCSSTTLKIMNASKKARLLIGKGGLYGNVLRIAPPLTITKKEAEELVRKLLETFKNVSIA
jgi:4-aminobutyrate aminotransferase-like enzyme